MNSGVNVLGQGNRANMTIGRAVQLTIRNVGGGRPGEIDRAAHGMPGKLSFCFAEDEIGSPWTSLAVARGVEADTDAVTVFAGEGPRCVTDQLARTPEQLVTSLAATLLTVEHPKLPLAYDAMLVVGPEHARVFGEAGWSRERVIEELHARLQLKGTDIVRGSHGRRRLAKVRATDRVQVSTKRNPACSCRRWRRIIFRDHWRLGQWCRRL
jgi:hypothetical protein